MDLKNPQYAAFNFLLGRLRYCVELIGTKDGFNRFFMTPDKFINNDNIKIELFRNGVGPLLLGVGNDFLVSESGGLGSGYDTVELQFRPPFDWEILLATYIQDT